MGRVAVVTGGASGMGRSICEQLTQRGDLVAVLDINGEAASDLVRLLRREGAVAMAQSVDVSDRPTLDGALEQVRRELGRIEIMVTCAGITRWDALTEIDLDAWNRVLAVNLTGTFHCLQAVLPEMAAAGWGRVVTISSAAAQTGIARHAHYAASKGGVVALTRALAREFAPHGVTLNSIAPGIIDTPMLRVARDDVINRTGATDVDYASRIPVGRMGTGDDIAATCLFLCSEMAGYITGQLIGVNGGTQP
jgi:NAD(P)-dependent dehydrogenase (short-subunit alcohol dehydrogenase family)